LFMSLLIVNLLPKKAKRYSTCHAKLVSASNEFIPSPPPSPQRDCVAIMMEGRYRRNPALAGFRLARRWVLVNHDTVPLGRGAREGPYHGCHGKKKMLTWGKTFG
jgi:hypothetical protein